MVIMKERYLTPVLPDLCFSWKKIAFVSGPRQCGKTTLARMLLKQRKHGVYANWDEPDFRKAWGCNPRSIIPKAEGDEIPLLVLDEIHKHYRWKRHLKGVYDTLETPCDILVTGSARLNVYRRHSDSLLGRHFNFRLHPFSIREMENHESIAPDELIEAIFSKSLRRKKARQEHLDALMEHGPFPEPLFGGNQAMTKRWRRVREQMVIREDLRDFSKLPELDRVELMAAILPDRVGSLFSIAAMREDLECGFHTVKRWMKYLNELYYLFEIKPYGKKIPRTLKREGKVYLWDFGAVKDKAARFENLVACHLLKACHFWTDTGLGEFELFFLRNKEKQEIDFLIVRNGTPWLPVEVKMGETDPSPSWRKFAPFLPCKHCLQVVYQPEWKVHEFGDAKILVAGAAEALNYFV